MIDPAALIDRIASLSPLVILQQTELITHVSHSLTHRRPVQVLPSLPILPASFAAQITQHGPSGGLVLILCRGRIARGQFC